MLLDFDGVINCDRPGWPDPDKRASMEADGTVFAFRWSPMMLTKLAEFGLSAGVEVRWCSTWAPHAARLNVVLGTPAWPGCWDDAPPSVPRAKLAAAQAVLAEGKRLIWIDDEAIPLAKARRDLGMTGDALYLRPNPAKGISKGNIGQIRTFLARVPQ